MTIIALKKLAAHYYGGIRYPQYFKDKGLSDFSEYLLIIHTIFEIFETFNNQSYCYNKKNLIKPQFI